MKILFIVKGGAEHSWKTFFSAILPRALDAFFAVDRRVLRPATQITDKLLALVIYLIEIDARVSMFNRAIAKIYAFQLKLARLTPPAPSTAGD